MKRTFILLALAIGGIAAAFLLPGLGRRVATPPPVGPVVSSGAGSLTIRALPARHAFLASGDQLDVVYELTAAPLAGGKRAPVDFGLVFDRSGSMTGEPLAKAKAAATTLVGRLGPGDRLALVSFGSDARVELTATAMDEAGKADARRLIARIDADGGTNMSAALEAAARAIDGAGLREGAIRRLALLSDGQANEGLTGAALVAVVRGFAARGLRVSALGLGVEFDEDAMMAIADAGSGQFRYLRDGDETSAALTQELQQAAETAATAVALTIEATEGSEIVEVIGNGATHDSARADVPVADLAAGETRRIVLRVRTKAGAAGARALLAAKLRYVDVPAGHVARTAEATAQAEATNDDRKVAGSWDKDATKTMLRARWGSAVTKAARRFGDDDGDGARRELSAMAKEAREASAAIGDASIADEIEAQREEFAGAVGAADAPSAAPEARAATRKGLLNFGRNSSGL